MSPNQKRQGSDKGKPNHAEALAKLRGEIEQIDTQILRLFDQRMKTASLVAADKLISGKPVFDQAREEQLIEMAVSKTAPEHQPRAANLLKCLMRLSRGVQYEWLLDQGKHFDILSLIQSGVKHWPENPRIVCQGATGSYSAKACQFLFPGQSFSQTKTFEDACRVVWQDEADAAVLPLENTTAGTVDDVYDLLLKYDLYIWQSVSLPIRHVLAASPGTSINGIETVVSHPQALAQCSSYIKEHQWQIQESLNTAFAARLVADKKDHRLAAIASDTAAEAYQLTVLDAQISNTSHNQTRFIAIGKNPLIREDADRISLILRLPHQSGALASTLAIFSDRHLNLTKIQSRPDPQLPWTYLFYLDFEAAASNRKAALATLYHLSQEMPYLRFIGWYRENEG